MTVVRFEGRFVDLSWIYAMETDYIYIQDAISLTFVTVVLYSQHYIILRWMRIHFRKVIFSTRCLIIFRIFFDQTRT